MQGPQPGRHAHNKHALSWRWARNQQNSGRRAKNPTKIWVPPDQARVQTIGGATHWALVHQLSPAWSTPINQLLNHKLCYTKADKTTIPQHKTQNNQQNIRKPNHKLVSDTSVQKPQTKTQASSTAAKPADTKSATCTDSCSRKDLKSSDTENNPACCSRSSCKAGQSNTMWCSSSTAPESQRRQVRSCRGRRGRSHLPVSTRSWCEPVRS